MRHFFDILTSFFLTIALVIGAVYVYNATTNGTLTANAFTQQLTQQIQQVSQTIPQAPIVSTQPGTSLNWAGYVATGGQYTQVSGSWVVPTVSSSPTSSVDATWVGIGGVSSQDLIQAGTQANVSRLGNVTYQAWYEVLPNVSMPVSMDVSAGDSITSTISQTSANQWQISIVNNTNGESITKHLTYNSSLSSAEWVEEALSTMRGQEMALDNFGSVHFTGASAIKDGTNQNLNQLSAQPVTMMTQTGQTLASTSSVDSDGASFTVTRQSGISSGSITPGIRRQYRISVTHYQTRRNPSIVRQYVWRW